MVHVCVSCVIPFLSFPCRLGQSGGENGPKFSHYQKIDGSRGGQRKTELSTHCSQREVSCVCVGVCLRVVFDV